METSRRGEAQRSKAAGRYRSDIVRMQFALRVVLYLDRFKTSIAAPARSMEFHLPIRSKLRRRFRLIGRFPFRTIVAGPLEEGVPTLRTAAG